MRYIRMVRLQPDNGVDVSFSIGRLENVKWLIAKVSGDYGIGSLGNSNGAWISSIVVAGLVRFPCHGVVLDFTEMRYDMSDSLYGVIVRIRKHKTSQFPVFVLVSEKCRDGIVSLMQFTKDKSTRIVEDLSEVTNHSLPNDAIELPIATV